MYPACANARGDTPQARPMAAYYLDHHVFLLYESSTTSLFDPSSPTHHKTGAYNYRCHGLQSKFAAQDR
eukprot:m.95093 g.95093  ORF g.95093 m.95093 type:complete len:69 (+) comp13038_c0_seq6:172-378(+)